MGVLGVPSAQQRRRGRVQDSPHWWQGRQGHNRVIITVFATAAVLAIVWGAILKWADGDQRVVVVGTKPGITTQADRQALKDDCGSLPGVRVEPDKGDPSKQFRFAVRFDVSGITDAQLAALYTCAERHSDVMQRPTTENDGSL